jgi:23S rRNA (guanosine2251-2'-O)-methyltransferase
LQNRKRTPEKGLKPETDQSALKKNSQTEILYGIHPVFEAMRAGKRRFGKIYITKKKAPPRLEPVVKLAATLGIPVTTVSNSRLGTIAGTDMHQGIGASVSGYPFTEFSDILSEIKKPPQNKYYLIMDGVEDPQNLGALIRTALCAGTSGIIIPKNRAAPPTPASSRASAGALEHAKISMVTNIVSTVQVLKKYGVWIIGTDMNSDESIFSTGLAFPAAIVIGSEGKGIRPLVRKNCDLLVSIPQCGPVSSLNASAAGAIILYEAFRQRLQKENRL